MKEQPVTSVVGLPQGLVYAGLSGAHPLFDTHAIRRVSRVESASPATGVHAIHVQEQRQLFEDAFAGLS